MGYDFWSAIADQGHHFLMRVGGNVRLLKNLGHVRQRKGIVCCWPAAAMRKKQKPLMMRLLQFRSGTESIYLVTSVLSERDLPAQVARELYRQRWGIEVQFRSLKQTFERGKLRSRNPDRATVEMHWSLLGLCVIQLWALKEQLPAGHLPEALSIAAAIRAVRRCFDELHDPPQLDRDLRSRLRRAILDDYQRRNSKQARYRPDRGGCHPPLKPPSITVATHEHNRRLRKHFQQLAA